MLHGNRAGLIVAGVVIAGLGGFAAIGSGDARDVPFAGIDKAAVRAHAVERPSGGALGKGAVAASPDNTRLFVKETEPEAVAPGFSVVTVSRCGGADENRQAAINGYFARAGSDAEGVVSQGSAPTLNLRRWQLAVNNTNSEQVDVVFGIVCLRP